MVHGGACVIFDETTPAHQIVQQQVLGGFENSRPGVSGWVVVELVGQWSKLLPTTIATVLQ